MKLYALVGKDKDTFICVSTSLMEFIQKVIEFRDGDQEFFDRWTAIEFEEVEK